IRIRIVGFRAPMTARVIPIRRLAVAARAQSSSTRMFFPLITTSRCDTSETIAVTEDSTTGSWQSTTAAHAGEPREGTRLRFRCNRELTTLAALRADGVGAKRCRQARNRALRGPVTGTDLS